MESNSIRFMKKKIVSIQKCPSLIRTFRPFIFLSNPELTILIFRSEKKMGLLMQSDFAKSDGIKSD